MENFPILKLILISAGGGEGKSVFIKILLQNQYLRNDYQGLIYNCRNHINDESDGFTISGIGNFDISEKSNYYISNECFIIMTDVTNRHSLQIIPRLKNEIENRFGKNQRILVVVNKIDLNREILESEIGDVCNQLNLDFVEISAIENININNIVDLFEERKIAIK